MSDRDRIIHRRQEKRLDIASLKVIVSVTVLSPLAQRGETLTGPVENFSPNGIRLKLDKPLLVSSRIRLEYVLESERILCEGRVVWARQDGDTVSLGVKYYQFARQEDGETVADFVARNAELFPEVTRRTNAVVLEGVEGAPPLDRRIRKSLFARCVSNPQLDLVKSTGIYFREITSVDNPWVEIKGKRYLSFTSCSYLGLEDHPKVIEATVNALHKYGTNVSASRVLGGTLELHLELERRIASINKVESSILYALGFCANIGSVPTLVESGDLVIGDSRVHMSLVDGCRLSGARYVSFRHNDVEDLARQLELPGRNKLVITEGVFSMDGAFAPLDAIHELCERHEAALFLDDAHGFCVVGPTGGGVPEIHGLQGKIDLLMGTLSKAIPCFGGYIAGKKAVIDYLRYMSRSFKFTVTLPPPVVCAILACLDLVEAHPELRTDLLKKSAYFREALQSRGFSSGTPGSPIVPVFIRDELKTMELARLMEDEGVYVDPSIFPGVQRGEELLRFAVTNKHTTEQLDMTVDALDRCARKMAFHS